MTLESVTSKSGNPRKTRRFRFEKEREVKPMPLDKAIEVLGKGKKLGVRIAGGEFSPNYTPNLMHRLIQGPTEVDRARQQFAVHGGDREKASQTRLQSMVGNLTLKLKNFEEGVHALFARSVDLPPSEDPPTEEEAGLKASGDADGDLLLDNSSLKIRHLVSFVGDSLFGLSGQPASRDGDQGHDIM